MELNITTNLNIQIKKNKQILLISYLALFNIFYLYSKSTEWNLDNNFNKKIDKTSCVQTSILFIVSIQLLEVYGQAQTTTFQSCLSLIVGIPHLGSQLATLNRQGSYRFQVYTTNFIIVINIQIVIKSKQTLKLFITQFSCRLILFFCSRQNVCLIHAIMHLLEVITPFSAVLAVTDKISSIILKFITYIRKQAEQFSPQTAIQLQELLKIELQMIIEPMISYFKQLIISHKQQQNKMNKIHQQHQLYKHRILLYMINFSFYKEFFQWIQKFNKMKYLQLVVYKTFDFLKQLYSQELRSLLICND
ncbi:unnamed protein product [Paramecium pentaurelia]|uniref:Uncharacterized protein n=1 Tax=Paramecium pentaurelia TaxID=43138 RepID=A0A8S1UUR5_9CILI|nr:unnamed protein product [Paramecium pentaurelia]